MYVKDGRRTTVTKESVFKIVDETEFLEMEHSTVQEILREQHIVVTNKQYRKKSFEKALSDIAPADWVTGIQGTPFSSRYVSSLIHMYYSKIIPS